MVKLITMILTEVNVITVHRTDRFICSGSFVLDVASKRWAMDFGAASYALPNYWSKTATGGTV